MQVTKRDGRTEAYDRQKIARAMGKALAEVGDPTGGDAAALESLLARVETALATTGATEVEQIQDLVERTLMEAGHYDAAKAYILYRHRRAELRATRHAICSLAFGSPAGQTAPATPASAAPAPATSDAVRSLDAVLAKISRDFDPAAYPLSALAAKFRGFAKPSMSADERADALVRAAVELTTPEAPGWDRIAGRLLSLVAARRLAREERARGLDGLYDKIRYLTDQGLYGSYILERYTREEIDQAASWIDPTRDELLDYPGLDLLLKRYVICSHDHIPLESPQEMFMGIALHLALREGREARMAWVRRFYDVLSRLEVTMATPTMSNARKPHHQLSSCFIDTVPDSLEGIYRSVNNFAMVSKFGGGMGMYLGKVRAKGGSIRGFEGAAGGVVRWIRVINDTAVAVDQLGVRAGAVAVYLDAWHRDLPEFLQLRTNNGDDRMKAHDVFPAVCYPDLFWRMAEEDLNQPWHLMCPHDILTVKGYALEDYFGEEWERRYLECVADPRIPKRSVTVKDIVRLVLRSAVETGTPFAFMRDTVNRANPNPHAGMIYCSNLCTEIAQNTSEIQSVSQEVVTADGDTVVVATTRPGDFVVCNLASLSLGRIPVEDDACLARTVQTAVRALDNVIDLNFYALPYAKVTNRRYRSVGLGVSGYHHMLAKRGIMWESEEHLRFADDVFERINRHAIEASCALAEERGAYEKFEGSDWQTGAYFEKRGYTSPEWRALASRVAAHGMRNAYLLAVAPTSSTSIVAGTTAGLDPVMRKFFLEEKKGSMLPRVAPELSPATWWYYKPAHMIDQTWSMRAAGVRQRHIDQAQSVNLYITNECTMRQVLNLYLEAWRDGVKTVYYVRSKSLEVEECESCSS
ncbi:MAG: ribonucleoside-diphosphate reductase subunit alpha [Tractidigestivibacter sp.]|uniref:ribonucleoside-diphosphate reductase subunit alpha n=1 Tax=Tractidigestivibacter sp. TaxID=2847320 RepID=UPI002A7F800E|nr:ribonucleoside-diphosphate reductase subunit alpha [Tractidigestivibacter sp.]MDY4535250.1 ribonucleoside-diphosphate reductase subunit alpha [Tractidigestivibacter sp.]